VAVAVVLVRQQTGWVIQVVRAVAALFQIAAPALSPVVRERQTKALRVATAKDLLTAVAVVPGLWVKIQTSAEPILAVMAVMA
jgi:hypothetical protein